MTAAVSARKAARVPCPHCAYTAEPGASIAGHVAMAHPERDTCTRDETGCRAHQAVWMPGDERCAARGGRLSPTSDEPAPADFKSAAMHRAGIPSQAEVVAFVGRRPEEELACIGANHIPGCDRFEAPAVVPTPAGAQLLEIPLDLVDVGTNVRVDVAELEELAASIAEHGVLQPVKAFQTPEGRFRLVWGQRRTLAARAAGLTTIPAIVQPFAEATAGATRSIEQLVENLHRADLNPIDRAEAMRKVVDAGVSQADLARKLGIAPSTVSNDLRLLTLDEKVVDLVRKGEVSGSHAKAMASLSASHQRDLASRIVATKLTSHQVEQELSWRRADTASKEAAAARTEKAIPKLLAVLEAGVPKTATVSLRAPYNMEREALARAAKKAGWDAATGYVQERPAKGKCDCAAVIVEFNRKWTVTPGCTNDKHRDRARNLEHLEDNAWRETIAAKVEDLAARILVTLTAAHAANLLPVPVLVLIAGDRYEIPELIGGEGDEDRSQLLKMAADRLAVRADASRSWGQHRAPAEKALDDLLAMLGTGSIWEPRTDTPLDGETGGGW